MSEGVGLIVRAISFQDFQPMWSQITNVTDGRTDRRTDGRHAIPRPRICTKVHCAVKKIRYGANSENIVNNLYPKFNYHPLRSEKVLGNWKSDNNSNHKNNSKNNVRSHWGPVLGSKNKVATTNVMHRNFSVKYGPVNAKNSRYLLQVTVIV